MLLTNRHLAYLVAYLVARYHSHGQEVRCTHMAYCACLPSLPPVPVPACLHSSLCLCLPAFTPPCACVPSLPPVPVRVPVPVPVPACLHSPLCLCLAALQSVTYRIKWIVCNQLIDNIRGVEKTLRIMVEYHWPFKVRADNICRCADESCRCADESCLPVMVGCH